MSSGTIHLRELAPRVYPGRVDREKGVVYGLAILGPDSANGRRYLESAMRAAVPLYEGRKSYVDHVRDGQDPSAYDSLGVWHNPRFQDGRIRGDFSVNREHPMAKAFLEACERPDLHEQFGFSHDANGKEQAGSRGAIIESIDAVNSVDLVGDPATNKSLWESRSMTTAAVTAPRNKAKSGSGTWTKKTAAAILTEALRPGARRKLREAVLKRLTENDGPMYMDDTMEATPGASGDDLDAEATPAHGAELFQEIVDIIDKCLETADKGSLSPEYLDKLQAIKDIAASHDSGSDADGDDDGDEPPDDTSSQESRKKKGKKGMADHELREQVRQLRAENTAIRLANEAGIKLSATQLKALCHLSEAEIKTAIEEHKTALVEAAKAAGQPAKVPALPPSPNANGTHVVTTPAVAPKDAKEFLSVLEQRARQKR